LLTDSGDLQFAKWFIDTFPEKHGLHQYSQSKGIDNSKLLIDLSEKKQHETI
jgi:hypothetical protein